jgi:hypothetical protein
MRLISSSLSGDSMKQDVRPRLCVHLAAPQRLIEAERGARIGARHDEEIRVAPAFHGDRDLARHVLRRNHAPARRVPTFLREFLVLELDARGPRCLIAANRLAYIEKAAVTGVAVGDQGRLGHARHGGHAAEHVGVGGEPGIWQTKRGRHSTIACHIEKFEPHAIGDLERDHVVDAGRGDEALFGEALLQGWGHEGNSWMW